MLNYLSGAAETAPAPEQPNKRFITVQEIGALAAFLCSDGARSITGAALPIDGAWTAH